jgi:hypothetical protein
MMENKTDKIQSKAVLDALTLASMDMLLLCLDRLEEGHILRHKLKMRAENLKKEMEKTFGWFYEGAYGHSKPDDALELSDLVVDTSVLLETLVKAIPLMAGDDIAILLEVAERYR